MRHGPTQPRGASTRRKRLAGALKLLAAAAAGVMATAPGRVAAEPASASFAVTAAVVPLCSIAVSSLSFGAYDPLLANAGADLDAAATVSVTCTKGTAGQVAMDGGANFRGDNVRQMAMGSERLAYQIYKDPIRATVWAPGRTGVPLIGGGVARGPERITVYARIFAGQIVPAGIYTDTVRATVEF